MNIVGLTIYVIKGNLQSWLGDGSTIGNLFVLSGVI